MSTGPELLAVTLNLRAEKSGELPATNGRMVHGAFLKMAATYSEVLSKTLHTAQQERPFTLSGLRGGSPLRHKSGNEDPSIPITAGGHYWIRITSLKASLSRHLIDMLEATNGSSLTLGAVPFTVADHEPSPLQRTGTAAYADLKTECLHDASAPLPWFGWSFISATAIHSGGRNLLFPEPSAIFPRLAARWNRFCPEAYRLPYRDDKEVASLAERSLMLSAHDLRTHMLENGGKGRQIGFSGYVEFLPAPNAAGDHLKLCNLLVRFSFFSGIGYATTKGMGQVDFIIP